MMAGKWLHFNGRRQINKKHAPPGIPVYSLHAHSVFDDLISFHDFRGQYILIVNTASDCGYTAQYAELEALQQQFKGRLSILAFPANNFGNQEKGNDADIAAFCESNYDVSFPVIKKSDVIGPHKNEVYQWLTDPVKNGWNNQEPSWNFCKYLISPSGNLLGFFESGVSPLSDDIAGRIR